MVPVAYHIRGYLCGASPFGATIALLPMCHYAQRRDDLRQLHEKRLRQIGHAEFQKARGYHLYRQSDRAQASAAVLTRSHRRAKVEYFEINGEKFQNLRGDTRQARRDFSPRHFRFYLHIQTPFRNLRYSDLVHGEFAEYRRRRLSLRQSLCL